ncbi:MAG: hypothetical protein WC640_00980 [Candidatus Paceibacterota bacterium]|jgi:hypothetical protein
MRETAEPEVSTGGKKKQDNKDIIVERKNLRENHIDIEGRDMLIAFNEPSFKFSKKNLKEADLDSKLNARLVSYFLPMVEVARKQERRPRMFVVSGLNMALKWNAKNDHQKKIMAINNNLKFDFLKSFFEKFFPDDFSIIEYVVAQDPIKISENKLMGLWNVLERKYPKEIGETRLSLAKYKKSRLFGNKELSDEAISFVNSRDDDLINAFKYAISHLFAMGDINFEGNNIHNPVGYLTVGGSKEKTFNTIRKLALEVLRDVAEIVFEREVIYTDNLRMIVEAENKAPVPYNGYFQSIGGKTKLLEVTYENNKSLDFYGEHEQLKSDTDYIYSFIPRQEYERFWNDHRDRYLKLKRRYQEAYDLKEDF